MLFECPKVSDKYPIKLSSPNFFENFIPSSKFLIKTPADDKKLSAETKKGPMKSFFSLINFFIKFFFSGANSR